MSLSPAQLAARDGKLTASAIGCLMTGDAEKITNLWRFMVGDPSFEDRDWEHFWPARLGHATEALNLEWWEYDTGRPLSRQGEVVMHPVFPWASSTLDAFDDGLVGPVDAKHVGGFETLDTIRARYLPQMTWQMDCTGTKRSALSVIQGAKEPVAVTIEWDAEYSAELWRRAEAFMRCVEDLMPPIPLAPVTAPVPAIREVDMTGNNEWAFHAGYWLENRSLAKTFENSVKSLKGMVPADAAKCFGHGLRIDRSKNGALSIKEFQA